MGPVLSHGPSGGEPFDEPSAHEQYCAAGESLESSVQSLVDLDVVAEGTNGVESAVNQVADDVSELRETAGDAAAGDVDSLASALSGLESALSAVSGELTQENVAAVADAVPVVSAAANGVTRR